MGKENGPEKAVFMCPVCFTPFSARSLHEHIAECHLSHRCLQIAYCPKKECKKKRNIFSVSYLTEHICHKTCNGTCKLIFPQKDCAHRSNCQILLDKLMNFSFQVLGPVTREGKSIYHDPLQEDRIKRCRQRPPYQQYIQGNATPACFVKDHHAIPNSNGNSGHGLGRGSAFDGIGRNPGFGGGGRSPGYGGGSRSPGYGGGDRSPGYGDGGRSPGYGDGGRSPGYGGGGRSPGYGDGGRSPGYGRGDRSPGYGDGGRSPGYDGRGRSPGFGGGDRSPGYGGGGRSPGYDGGDRSPGYGGGGRSPGNGGGGRSPGYGRGDRSPGYGDGGRSPGYGGGDRSPGYNGGGRSPGNGGGDRSPGYGGEGRSTGNGRGDRSTGNGGSIIARCRSPGYVEQDLRISGTPYTRPNTSHPQDNEASTLAGSSNIISRSTVHRSQNSQQEGSTLTIKNELNDSSTAVEISLTNHSRQNMTSKPSTPLTTKTSVATPPSRATSHSSHNFPAPNPAHSVLNGYNPPRISGSNIGNLSGQTGSSSLHERSPPIPWHTGSSYSGYNNIGSNSSRIPVSPRRESMDSLLKTFQDTKDSECPMPKKKRPNDEPNRRH